jgi:hypothetical protein
MNVQKSIDLLRSKKGVWVNPVTDTIVVVKNGHNAGIGSWKHIDYLVNHCGYAIEYK